MNKVINQSKLFQFIADGGQGQTVPCCMLLILLEVINYVFIFFFSTRRRDIYSQGPFELFP